VIELGGTFVHWSQPHVWSELTRYGLTHDLISGTEAPEWSLTPHDDGLRWTPSSEQFTRETALMERFFEGSETAMPRPYQPGYGGAAETAADHRLITERLDEMGLGSGDRDLLETFFTTHVCGDLREGSVLSELKMWAPAGHSYFGFLEAVFGYRLRHGTVSLLSKILADGGAELRLHAPVRTIRVGDDDVTIGLDDGRTVTARTSVLAVPTGTWSDLNVTPALDERKLSASRQGMQARYVVKGYMRIRGEGRAISVLPKAPHPITMMSTSHRHGTEEQVMVFWGTELLGDPTEPGRIESAVRTLLPDVEVLEAMTRTYTVDDPFTRGGWAIIRTGEQTSIDPSTNLARPEGRLFFASADIATGWHGYIDGAIESGLNAARGVLSALQESRPVSTVWEVPEGC
jgi:nicotine oxidoreductase